MTQELMQYHDYTSTPNLEEKTREQLERMIHSLDAQIRALNQEIKKHKIMLDIREKEMLRYYRFYLRVSDQVWLMGVAEEGGEK